MSPEKLFDNAMESTRNDRLELIQFLGQFSDTQAQWKPPDGEWSIAQGVEHILLTDKYVRKILLNTLQKAEKSDNWDNAPDVLKKMNSEELRGREQGIIQAPDHLLPVAGCALSKMMPNLMPSREETDTALSPYRSKNLKSLIPPIKRYGDLNVYDRMAYMGIHDALHKEQMDRVIKARNFPQAV